MRVSNNASIVKWYNSGFVTRCPQFDSEWEHHLKERNMEKKLGIEAINAAADEMIAKINELRQEYFKDALENPENFAQCDQEDAYVWFAESLF